MMVQIDITVKSILFLHFLCFSRDDIHQCGDSDPVRKLLIRMNMRMRNVARSNDCNLNHIPFLHFLYSRKSRSAHPTMPAGFPESFIIKLKRT